eukprot:8111049-Pyramimonas_sp.AAC.1
MRRGREEGGGRPKGRKASLYASLLRLRGVRGIGTILAPGPWPPESIRARAHGRRLSDVALAQ